MITEQAKFCGHNTAMGKKMREALWRAWLERVASDKTNGLKYECLAIFDYDMRRGADPKKSALDALYEWDCDPMTDKYPFPSCG